MLIDDDCEQIEPTLATAIQENLGIPCRSDDTIRELVRGIRTHFTQFVKSLAAGLLEQAQLGLGHSYSRSKVSDELFETHVACCCCFLLFFLSLSLLLLVDVTM